MTLDDLECALPDMCNISKSDDLKALLWTGAWSKFVAKNIHLHWYFELKSVGDGTLKLVSSIKSMYQTIF